MTLLIIIAALAIERYATWPARLRDFGWYERHLEWLSARVPGAGAAGLALALVAPVLVVLALQGWLSGGLASLVGVVFAWLVLTACLGPDDLPGLLDEYLGACTAGDDDRAEGLRRRLGAGEKDEPGEDLGAVVWRAHQQYFGVLFWFVLLGPVGALLYRLLRFVEDYPHARAQVREAAEVVGGVLAWPSTRLAALSLALVGNFDRVLPPLTASLRGGGDLASGNRRALADAGRAAIDFDPGAETLAGALPRLRRAGARALWLWLALLALLILGGWLR